MLFKVSRETITHLCMGRVGYKQWYVTFDFVALRCFGVIRAFYLAHHLGKMVDFRS